jgi:hypothetical protein
MLLDWLNTCIAHIFIPSNAHGSRPLFWPVLRRCHILRWDWSVLPLGHHSHFPFWVLWCMLVSVCFHNLVTHAQRLQDLYSVCLMFWMHTPTRPRRGPFCFLLFFFLNLILNFFLWQCCVLYVYWTQLNQYMPHFVCEWSWNLCSVYLIFKWSLKFLFSLYLT